MVNVSGDLMESYMLNYMVMKGFGDKLSYASHSGPFGSKLGSDYRQ